MSVSGQRLAHVEAQVGVAFVQVGDDQRHQVGAERLDHTDADRAGERTGLTGDHADILDLAQNASGAGGDLALRPGSAGRASAIVRPVACPVDAPSP